MLFIAALTQKKEFAPIANNSLLLRILYNNYYNFINLTNQINLIIMNKKHILILIFIIYSGLTYASNIGKWIYDEVGLPCFNYSGTLPYVTPNISNDAFSQCDDPYFLLGNHRLTVFQHTSGIYQILSGERAWGILNRGDIDEYAQTWSELQIDKKAYKLTGKNSISLNSSTKKLFGSGFARFDYKLPEVECSRVVSVRPSDEVKDGIPALLIQIYLKNNGETKKTIRFSETVVASYKRIGAAKGGYYLCNSTKNGGNTIVKTDFTFKSPDPGLLVSETDPSYYDAFPPSFYMKRQRLTSSSVKSEVSIHKKDSTQNEVSIKFELELDPGSSETLFLVVGYEFHTNFEKINNVFGDVKIPQATNSISGAMFQNEWRNRVPGFEAETDEILKRELQWDAYILEAMTTYVKYYDEIFVPQGMSYDYRFGNPAAFRDHAQSALPLCYYRPEMARSILKLCLKKIRYSGEIRYTDTGFGATTNLVWNTSDQQLYLFLLLGEYLRITKDYSILSDKTEWYPVVLNNKATTIEKVHQAFSYLRDEIGFGTKGLIRLMNSDWNDQIFHTHPINAYFYSASSHLNSAMAIVVLENLKKQLTEGLKINKNIDANNWQPLIESISMFNNKVKTAFDTEMQNRPFSPRGYLTETDIFGSDNMYLEPQPWILMRNDIPEEKKLKLFATLQSKLLNDEVLGARQMEKPISMKTATSEIIAGESENGGFWFSLNGPLILGVSTFDKQESMRLLKKMTFANFAKNYPNYWVGQWSNADCINSSKSELPGLSRPDIWTEYPVFCSHPHAWPLYCYYKITSR